MAGGELRAAHQDKGRQTGLPRSPANTEAGKAAIAKAFADMGVELPTTKTGRPSTSSDAMKNADRQRAPTAQRKSYDSPKWCCRSTGSGRFIRPWRIGLVGDRIHPQLSACQASGRFSVTPGNDHLWQTWREGRLSGKCVLPDSDDHVSDRLRPKSQIDARAVAAHCQDPAYLDMFELDADGNPRDIHTEMAVTIWGDPSRRSDAKPINHGINYGMSSTRLAQRRQGMGLLEAQGRSMATFWRKFAQAEARGRNRSGPRVRRACR